MTTAYKVGEQMEDALRAARKLWPDGHDFAVQFWPCEGSTSWYASISFRTADGQWEENDGADGADPFAAVAKLVGVLEDALWDRRQELGAAE